MLDIPRLKSFGMNDKTSSIQVKSYVNDANLRVVLIAFEMILIILTIRVRQSYIA